MVRSADKKICPKCLQSLTNLKRHKKTCRGTLIVNVMARREGLLQLHPSIGKLKALDHCRQSNGPTSWYTLYLYIIISLFCLIVTRSLFLLKNQKDFFMRNCGVGSISFFALQAIINLGVSVRLLPAKGMTLPFISYGGSSLLASGLLMGLLLSCTRKRIANIVHE